MTNQPSPLSTLAEAASHLRLTNRAAAKSVKRYGLCMIAGRTLLFSEADIEGKGCRVNGAGRPKRSSPKPALSGPALSKSLMKLTRKKVSPAARKLRLSRVAR